MEYIETLGANAKAAEPAISVMGTNEKNRVLSEISSLLRSHVTEIIGANKLDIETARANGMSEAMIDRLTLTEQRIGGMADGVDKVISLPDPVGAVIGGSDLPNGLHVIKKRVPIGTIGIIFESRPNVTVDAATLCFKAGNTVILRGGSDAINSNKALVGLMRTALRNCGVNENAVQLVEDTSRAVANAMMKLNKYIDLLIPRGGDGGIELANAVVETIESTRSEYKPLYDEKLSIKEKLDVIAKEIYRADGVNYTAKADKAIKEIESLGLDRVPVCVAKTQYSLSDDPTKLGRPEHFSISVSDVRASAGAGFVVVYTGDVMTMPGLPKVPAADNIDVDADGRITGLF